MVPLGDHYISFRFFAVIYWGNVVSLVMDIINSVSVW